MGGLPQPERVQLERILNHYRSATTLNSTMSLMVDNPEAHENFVSCLQHDVSILLNRSQDMGNHECSTSQKALVILMNKEHNIVAAANLYAEEILGFSAVPSDAESLKAQTKARKDIVESMFRSLGEGLANEFHLADSCRSEPPCGSILSTTGFHTVATERNSIPCKPNPPEDSRKP